MVTQPNNLRDTMDSTVQKWLAKCQHFVYDSLSRRNVEVKRLEMKPVGWQSFLVDVTDTTATRWRYTPKKLLPL